MEGLPGPGPRGFEGCLHDGVLGPGTVDGVTVAETPLDGELS